MYTINVYELFSSKEVMSDELPVNTEYLLIHILFVIIILFVYVSVCDIFFPLISFIQYRELLQNNGQIV